MINYKEYNPIEHKEWDLFFNNKMAGQFRLFVSEYPELQRLNEEIEFINIEGRSGSLSIKKSVYKDRVIKVKFKLLDNNYFWSNNYFWNNLRSIERWLAEIKDNRLVYDMQDKCYIVKKVEIGDISREVRLYGEFTAAFIVEPFLTDLSQFSSSWLENDYILINIGDFEVLPQFTFEGNGNVTVTINDETLIINNVVDEVTVNSDLMLCYGKNNNNKLLDMVGNFPKLKVGENTISVSNNIDKTKVTFSNLYR